MEATLQFPRYISAEEFDLMFDDELDTFIEAQDAYELILQSINNEKNKKNEEKN
jgi:hypothetical protein